MIEAPDERTARSQAKIFQIGKVPVAKSIKLLTPGSKGFLGIGKRLNQYEVEVLHEAVVEVTYKTNAKISAKMKKLEHQEISMLVKDIENIWK